MRANEPPPWTIRGVDVEIRNAMLNAAKRNNENIGQWLNRVGREMILDDRDATRAVAVVSDQPPPPPEVSLVELATAASTLATVADLPRGIRTMAFGLVRDRLKLIRSGQPRLTKPVKPSDTNGVSV